MALAVSVQSIASEMSTFAPPSSLKERLDRDRDRDRQRRGSVASTSSRRLLPRNESCLLGSEETNKESSDDSRRRSTSICSSLGRGSVGPVISTPRAEKRTTLGMGLREQEQVCHFLHLSVAVISELVRPLSNFWARTTNTMFFDIVAYDKNWP